MSINSDLVGVFLIRELAEKFYEEKYSTFKRTVIGKINFRAFLA